MVLASWTPPRRALTWAAVLLLVHCGPCEAAGGRHHLGKSDERYLQLVEEAVTGSLFDEAGSCNKRYEHEGCPLDKVQPYVRKVRLDGTDWPPFGFTMIGHTRLRNLRHAIQTVTSAGVPGDVVELGTWRGGACVYAKAVLDVLGEEGRHVHLFDAFSKLRFYGGVGGGAGKVEFLSTSLEGVKHTFHKFKLLDERVHFHKGWFNATLPTFRATLDRQQAWISVLRIDGNVYGSYQDALYQLYERVPTGGVVIFDDVFHNKRVLAAVRDFMSEQGLPEKLQPVDPDVTMTGGWFIKMEKVDTNWRFFRNSTKLYQY